VNSRELTEQQIEQQDFVDNAIFKLLQSLNLTDKEIQWDIKTIGDVRDVIKDWLVKRIQIINEQNFYPYL
jgi:hypothetical protein